MRMRMRSTALESCRDRGSVPIRSRIYSQHCRIVILNSRIFSTVEYSQQSRLQPNYVLSYYRPRCPKLSATSQYERSVLAPIIARRCVLLLSNTRILIICKLLLGSLAQCLYSIDSAWYPPYLVRELTARDETEHETRTNNERQNESVLSV
jgi:hypothetical protein